MARGRTADVYALDPRTVLRRYRDGGDVAAEAAVMTHLHRLGFPVPRVDAASGTDLVMERVDGPTMAQALIDGELSWDVAAKLLADLHRRLHALPARLSTTGGIRIRHLDLHPANVLISARGAVVIDWRNADEGAPELDVAMSALIIAQVGVDQASAVAPVATRMVRCFLASTGHPPHRVLDEAAAMRAADPNVSPAELRALPQAVALVAGQMR
jgi:aminoglycoside phosphotransferase (APT) family kinase protein